jgi:hypothetical protein
MFHHVTTNLRQNELIIIRCFITFHFDVIHKQKRVMKNMIDDIFINHSNELNY